MRDANTNSVHVVSLRRQVWEGWPADLSPVDEVERHRIYHYPTRGGNYPKIVPTYMGFRYDSRLQSIHHVEAYEIVDSPFGLIPGAPVRRWAAVSARPRGSDGNWDLPRRCPHGGSGLAAHVLDHQRGPRCHEGAPRGIVHIGSSGAWFHSIRGSVIGARPRPEEE